MSVDLSQSALIELALDLSRSMTSNDRFERLLDRIRKLIPCDAIALLVVENAQLKPLALQGLMPDVAGRRFTIADHPRFAQICAASEPLVFPRNSTLPDPYDGLLLARSGDLPVHACMGLPLRYDQELLGVLTLDSLDTGAFERLEPRTLHLLSALASASLQTALTLELLEHQVSHSQRVAVELSKAQLQAHELIGDSAVMQNLKRAISVVAASDFTVLIQGETGTGKELVAQQLHQESARALQPLVQINCAALPEQLVESELFGHVKGAFTGASANREGKFSLADGGTLFLDEVGELPLAIQSKLLRALQSGEIQPLGQDQVQRVDVRVIAATNRNLEKEVAAGRFRADLYHRLSVYPLNVPALSERIEDLHLLVGFFAERIKRQLGIRQLKISPQTLSQLKQLSWPGNVRELEHVISRAALAAKARQPEKDVVTLGPEDCGVMAQSVVTHRNRNNLEAQDEGADSAMAKDELKDELNGSKGLRESTEDFQRHLIVATLERTGGNWAAAARILQTDRANLMRLGKRLGLEIKKTVYVDA